MMKLFDVGIDALARPANLTAVNRSTKHAVEEFFGASSLPLESSQPGKSFYLETFGCQMNVHDSEKVAGVLLGGLPTGRKSRARRPGPLQHMQHSRKGRAESFSRARRVARLLRDRAR